MTEPIVLAEDESRRLVQLEAIHEIDREGSFSQLHTASITQSGVTVRRIRSAEPPVSFYMDADVMDALCAAWTGSKDAHAAQKKAKTERKQAMVAEAYAIVNRHPAIKIKQGKDCWTVSIPSQGYTFCSPAYYPENLLEQVKTCRAVLQGQTASGGDAA
jgi:hypothetical protein